MHSDVCGPMHTESIGGRKYFVMSIHDCAVYFPRHKSKVLEKFKRDATNESGRTIGTLQTDNDGEYLSRNTS